MTLGPKIPRPVWFLGWASLCTDAANEIIYPLLPVYLSRVLGVGALSLGVIEGVAEGLNSLLKFVSGHWSDRVGRRRPIVIAGYALSSLARPLVALTTSWPQVLFVRALDRTGKGIRGAPRDAMLARLAGHSRRGRIFGFHQAMDHIGAILGPLLATLFLYFLPGRYRQLFALTAIPGALAVAMLFLVKEEKALEGREVGARDMGGRERGTVEPRTPERVAPSALPRPLASFLVVLLVFSLGNSADAFLLLRLSEALGGATFIPLLWAGLHVVKASLSTWGGSLSDRVGRRQVIVAGWFVYASVYLGFAMSSSAAAFICWFLVYGFYFALTEGTEKALVADLAPISRHGAAFGYYSATLGLGTLTASVVFGLVYERLGATAAFGMGAGLSALAAVLLLLCVRVEPRRANSEPRTVNRTRT
ncbi:MAG: MFS transporter [Vicinamibacterales bacterium]